MYCHVAARALDGSRRVSHHAASTSLKSVHARPLGHSKNPPLRSQGTACIDWHVGSALNVYPWPHRRGHAAGIVTRVEAAGSTGAPHSAGGGAGDGDAQFDDDNLVSGFKEEDGAEVRDDSGAAEHSAGLHPGYYHHDASSPRGSWEERVREMPGFVPGGPPLERSVFQSLEDWSPATPPSARDMAYWFTEPEGGWGPPTERAWVPAPQPEEEHRGDLARHVDGEGRRVVEELVVGQVLRGRIVGHHLRLGVQVDIGAEYDALLAINDVDFTGEHARWGGRESDERVEGFGGARSEILKPEAEKQQEPSSSSHASSTPPHSMPLDLQPQVDLGPWEEVQRALPLDTWLEVEIVALRLARVSDRCLFRFPVQALPRDASLRGLFPPAEEHRAPCDWRGLGLQSLEEMVQLSGRAARPIQAWEKSVRTQRVERALGHAVPDPGTPGSLALWTGEALEAWEAQHREAVQRKPWLREALRDPEVKRRLEEHFLGEDAPTAEAAGLEEGVEDDLAACGIASVSFFTEAAWDEEFSDEE